MNAKPDSIPSFADSYALPLAELDTFFEVFAAEHDLVLENLPAPGIRRCFRARDREIHLQMDGNNDGQWYFWVSVSDEEHGDRYWKRRNLNGPVTARALQVDLGDLLGAAWAKISGPPQSDVDRR